MKIAIIGCGKQAPKHISGFLANGVTDFVFFDVNKDAALKLQEKYAGKVVAKLEDIFSDNTIHAVDICTPVDFHIPIMKDAIKSKKHFFCEKPLTVSLEEDEEIEKLASEANVIGMVGYIYRFVPSLSEVKNILDSAEQLEIKDGLLGNVHTAILRVGGRGSHMAWKHRSETGGGALNEMAVHMVDLAYWFFGPMKKVDLLECELRQLNRTINGETIRCNAEDWVVASLTSQSGVRILILADLVTPAFTQFVQIQGVNGSVSASIEPSFDSYIFLGEEKGSYKSGRTPLSFSATDYFASQMGEFIAAVKQNRQPDRNKISDSVAVMEIMEDLKRQAKNF